MTDEDTRAGGDGTEGAVVAREEADLNPVRTVGELRRLIADCADDLPVQVHHGWDLAIVESGFDTDGAVLLFVADDAIVPVSREWLEAVHPEVNQ